MATPIGNLGDISLRALHTLAAADLIACEDTRVSGGMLARFGIKKPLLPYHDHNAAAQRPKVIAQIAGGKTVALISDAGMPLIADPGFKLARECRTAGYGVTIVPGANAALTGLVASGLPSGAFYFAGFLPAKSKARQSALKALAGLPASLVFYEAPQRLSESLADMERIFGPNRPAAVLRELTKLFEEVKQGTLSELAGFYRATAVKGEIVLVVGAAEQKLAAAPSAIDQLLQKHMRAMSLRDAVNAVAKETSAKKGEVYARALWFKGKSGR